MKRALLLTLLLLALTGLASAQDSPQEHMVRGVVKKVLLPDSALIQGRNICVLFLETSTGTTAIIEDIYDCFFSQEFQSAIGEEVEFYHPFLVTLEDKELQDLLLAEENPSKFLLSDPE